MSLLPGYLKAIVALFTFSLLLFNFAVAAFAQTKITTPQPCQFPKSTSDLVDNYITREANDSGSDPFDPPKGMIDGMSGFGRAGTPVHGSGDVQFQVDFSKLQAIFGKTNSDYLEGNFQDTAHQAASIIDLNSSNFNQYFGPVQKTSPKVLVDQLKIAYVRYIRENPHLPETATKITDSAGQNPKTVSDLVNEFGLPEELIDDQDRSIWQSGWGRYWPKIPTAYNEFYNAELAFPWITGKRYKDALLANGQCPQELLRTINFVMPEFFRTAATSGQLNQILVPKEAQSPNNNLVLGTTDSKKSLVATIVEKCFKLATENPLAQTLKKVVKITLENLKPLKTAYAQQEDPSCIKILTRGKEGNASYCALPLGQLKEGDSCTNATDENKLDRDNPNVICTFNIHWEKTLTIGSDEWDERCIPVDPEDPDILSCSATIYIWPDFRIPYLATIWNNSLSSQENKPGIYGYFTYPSVIEEIRSLSSPQEKVAYCRGYPNIDPCPQIRKVNQDCLDTSSQGSPTFDSILYIACITNTLDEVFPGSVNGAGPTDPKQRYIGATDCRKNFVRDIVLKPKALQKILGIKTTC